ncbi:hypothetical protein ABW20_dc0100736 [Dactylellina cionopaga]|nr:hypothetical protein ABW20_dc0100736 [Dactylellina cionopaga]
MAAEPIENPSRYVDGPADERDEIIEAMAWELEHEQHLKTKARWDINDEYLAELDGIASQTLQETFHGPIVSISEKVFPQNIDWKLLATRLSGRTDNLKTARKYFPPFIKLPCVPETWGEIVAHPDMTSALFVEGILANTLANQICHCPALQADGELAGYLDTFYYHCMSIGPGSRDAAEWMALTLQMMHKMIYPDRTNPRYKHQPDIPDIKPIEESLQTRDIICALSDTLRLLREAVSMPFTIDEWNEVTNLITDLVVANFRLSVEWHQKPLAFKQQSTAWYTRISAESGGVFCDLEDEGQFLNSGVIDKSWEHHVIAVITPRFLREEWDKPNNAWWEGKVWMKPKLLIAPGPAADRVKLTES